jgi:hypothetical protein
MLSHERLLDGSLLRCKYCESYIDKPTYPSALRPIDGVADEENPRGWAAVDVGWSHRVLQKRVVPARLG